MTNSGPNGSQMNRLLEKWALEKYLGMVDAEPELTTLEAEALEAYSGTFETIATVIEVRPRDGGLEAEVRTKPEALAILREQVDDEVPEESETHILSMVAGEPDRYVLADGPAKGLRGYFSRGADGAVDGLHLGGRMANRKA
jgi:hypothetical protein